MVFNVIACTCIVKKSLSTSFEFPSIRDDNEPISFDFNGTVVVEGKEEQPSFLIALMGVRCPESAYYPQTTIRSG